MSENNICECCGSPMHHLFDFGTNKDYTINTEYCRYCLQKGVFTDHGTTLEQKIEKNITKTEKLGMPRKEATIFAH